MLFHHLYRNALDMAPSHPALLFGDESLTYQAMDAQVCGLAAGLLALGLQRGDRVCIYAGQSFEMVISMLAVSMAGGVFIPANPALKASQVEHIVRDSAARFVIVDDGRYRAVGDVLSEIAHLAAIIQIGAPSDGAGASVIWSELAATPCEGDLVCPGLEESSLAALLYTSGSTGRPKGVMLSHDNLTVGAASVVEYVQNSFEDRLLCVLPLSFDYGLSQLTTSMLSGATAVLINYLFPADVHRALAKYRITGLACVPPLWLQLLTSEWSPEAVVDLRYITNSGGQLPEGAVTQLRETLPNTELYLMYGLTEAFRSTYLDPAVTDKSPNAIGKPIPNVTIDVVNADGQPSAPGEHGELVHSGPLVAQGYWADPERSAVRFRPAPGFSRNVGEPAVWSGDIVYPDQDGLLYFVGRDDGQIKTSGYRVSPTEIEEIIAGQVDVAECVVVGVSHPLLGQAIVGVVVPRAGAALDEKTILQHCRRALPAFMVPKSIAIRSALEKNANGKIDRPNIQEEMGSLFQPFMFEKQEK
jgi:acyl-CoA ligase (AMP-forming) (exosortase A-associated)